MTVWKIEDLKVWQEARILCKELYSLTEKYPPEEKFNIIKHIKENGRGIPANIAEGFFRYNYQENIRFYRIARGCLGELKSDIYLSHDLNYIKEDELKYFINKIELLTFMLNSLIKKTRDKKEND